MRLIGKIPLHFERADFAGHVLAHAGCHGLSSVIPASSRLGGCSPHVAPRCVWRAIILGTTAGATANFAVSVCFDVAVPSAAAPADTNIASTEDAPTNTAAAGSVASSFSAGSQETAEALKLKLLEANFGEIVIGSFDEVIDTADSFSGEGWPIVIKVCFNQESK